MATEEPVTVKGTPVRSLQKFIHAELTPAQLDSLYAALSPDDAERFRAPVLPTETVPVRLLNRVTEEAAKVKREPLDSFARRAGREAAAEAVRGIYRFFALVLTPAALLSKASQMWSSIYNTGRLVVSEQTARTARIELRDFPSEVAGCARLLGWIEKMAELTGVEDVTINKTKCAARGDRHCEWLLRWR